MEHTRPSLALAIESIRKSFLDAKDRDVKLIVVFVIGRLFIRSNMEGNLRVR
ncbi:MAG TPA: hypothetical protein VEL11_10610 [Candidatus Bathyarchaeia archaeon]|nr:hypothetical protein [Candidatus Bathyarchaeia archaeon]